MSDALLSFTKSLSGSVAVPSARSAIALAFGVSRQPNVSRPTLLLATCSILTDSDGEDGSIELQVSPDNAVWTLLHEWRFYVEANALLGSSAVGRQMTPLETTILPAEYYRFVTVNHSGTPTYSKPLHWEATI